jgi:glycosyltransferase involved in cell wall biosynthesis
MRIHVYSMGWNEGRFLPFYLAHYGMFAERIVYFDNESDDETSQLLDADPRCERRTIATQGEMRDDILVQLKNSAWKESRGLADWVVVCDVDELLYHPALRQYLESCGTAVFRYPNQQATKWFPMGIPYRDVRSGSN